MLEDQFVVEVASLGALGEGGVANVFLVERREEARASKLGLGRKVSFVRGIGRRMGRRGRKERAGKAGSLVVGRPLRPLETV